MSRGESAHVVGTVQTLNDPAMGGEVLAIRDPDFKNVIYEFDEEELAESGVNPQPGETWEVAPFGEDEAHDGRDQIMHYAHPIARRA